MVSAVIGTHTHVQTADETILEHGTAYLTDAGMCGPAVGVLGRELEPILKRFRTSMPAKFPVAGWPVRLCGAVIRVDEETGKALNITRISQIVENRPPDHVRRDSPPAAAPSHGPLRIFHGKT